MKSLQTSFCILIITSSLIQLALGDETTLLRNEYTAPETWNFHLQSTTVSQGNPSMEVPYSGKNSLSPEGEFKTSLTATLFLGARLSKNAEIYLNPELSAGAGLSGSHGIAGFTNGEIYRVDDPSPKVSIARFYFQYIYGLGGDQEEIESDLMDIDTNILQAHADNAELEYGYKLQDKSGKVRVLAYMNHAHMGNYLTTLKTPAYNMDITQSREYSLKCGFGLNLEQEISNNLGLFSRMGWPEWVGMMATLRLGHLRKLIKRHQLEQV